MILNYKYNKYKHNLDISYVEDDGMKRLISFNVSRFKSYYKTPTGKYKNWDGSACDEKMTENPSKFDIKTFIYELPEQYKKLLSKRTFPKLYTFDIETAISDDFPEPSRADQEITVISVTDPNLNTLVFGTRELSQTEISNIHTWFNDYVNNVEFFHTLGIPMPKFKYVKFNNEADMLTYFLKNIVAKVPILSGWNCTLFDWQYIQNRIKNYYPDLSIKWASCKNEVREKKFTTKKNEDVYLQMPLHTLVLDMMDIIENEDHAVLPLKESMQLDYIAHETLNVNKISYKGTLQDLYDNDYPRYVFYNAIDSVLVQLIVHRFKVMDHIYLYSLYCNEQIDSCFSKIALTEALTFKDFYEHGLKIVWEDNRSERSRLIGAYVKKPISGIHGYVCCNDFASLYPSTIRTCNLSFENYVRSYHDKKALAPYECDPKYIVIGPNVYTNKGTAAKPELGEFVTKYLLEDQLEPYRKDPNFFVSVNGSVYRNDKDYAFRRIQATLKATRDHDKYLGKSLQAHVMHDLIHIMDGKKVKNHLYADDEAEHLIGMGFDITSSDDLISMIEDVRKEFKRILKDEIEYLGANEQAMKLLMNSMYGGCSHVAFYWYNMDLANDITGESRNLIHMMEHHIPDFWRKNWVNMKELHTKLGIEVDEKLASQALAESPLVTEAEDKDAYHERSFVYAAYGDTDSLYLSYNQLIKSIRGHESMSIDQKRDIIAKINTEFLNQHNCQFISDYYKTRFGKSVHEFELETIALSGVWLDVKKRYAQILLWKDGDIYDLDNLKMKIKGLEMVKASYPKLSRDILKDVVRFMLENADDPYLTQKLNIRVQQHRQEWLDAPLESICANSGVNGYTKYILKDDGEALMVAPKCPPGPRALGNYNRIRQFYHLPGQPIYGGKVKIYQFKNGNNYDYFGFQSMEYPEWASTYAPVDRNRMFQQFVLDPLNRITEAANLPKLNLDGSIQISLF